MSATVLPLRLIGSGYDKSPTITADSEWTVKDLYEAVALLKKAKISTFTLSCVAEFLDVEKDGKKLLRQYKFKPNGLVFCEKTPGGSDLQPLEGHVSLTREPCCVMGDNKPTEWRIKLNCGHVVAANTVKRVCETALDEKRYEFFCPGQECDLELTLVVVRHILSSVMTEQALNAMVDRMNENFVNRPDTDIRQCLVCHVNWRKDYRKRRAGHSNRVVCNTCSRNQGRKVEYCWKCGGEWIGNSYRCGHADCNLEKEQLLTLERCSTKTIGDVSGCPIIRACPRCGTLIQHQDRCKRMKCKCGFRFCFVCLKEKKGVGWDVHHTTPPVQLHLVRPLYPKLIYPCSATICSKCYSENMSAGLEGCFGVKPPISSSIVKYAKQDTIKLQYNFANVFCNQRNF